MVVFQLDSFSNPRLVYRERHFSNDEDETRHQTPSGLHGLFTTGTQNTPRVKYINYWMID